MALKRTLPSQAQAGLVKRFLMNYVMSKHDLPRLQVDFERFEFDRTSGVHWLAFKYQIPFWKLFWQNYVRFHKTGELLVGQDWRGNEFYVREDALAPGGVERFAKFIDPSELVQEYDTDELWKKWLTYKLEGTPSPQECARLHRFREEKFSRREAVLRRMVEDERRSPMAEKKRRFQEYLDQKWDLRVARATQRKVLQRSWVQARGNLPDITDMRFYSQKRDVWEQWCFTNIDKLRPPRSQKMWKLEEDARALRFMHEIDNARYLLDPFKVTRKERYMRTPSYVEGTKPNPNMYTNIYIGDRKRSGEERPVSNALPLQGMSSIEHYQSWFAQQRKALVAARAELEEMKRAGYRPAEVGGDLDPYANSRPLEYQTRNEETHKRLLKVIKEERESLEHKKKERLRELMGDEYVLATIAVPLEKRKDFHELPVRTAQFGKLNPGDAQLYRQKRLGSRRTVEAERPAFDEAGRLDAGSASVRSVFGAKGAGLFGADLAAKPPTEQPAAQQRQRQQQRPDLVAPDLVSGIGGPGSSGPGGPGGSGGEK